MFINAADELYGPITIVHCKGWIVKKVLWAVFKISDADWGRVLTVKSILEVCSSLNPSLFTGIYGLYQKP
jgi:hypothetical protein